VVSTGIASPFRDTRNKATIRQEIDLPLVKEVSERLGSTDLCYFGLPGAQALDVLAWRDFISRVHAVEREPEDATLLAETLNRYGLSHNLCIFKRYLEDHVMNENPDVPKDHIKYEIVNFDFQGFILTTSASSSDKRIRSIEKTIAIQKHFKNPFFLFLLTVQACRASHADFRKLCEEAEGIVDKKSSNLHEIFKHAMKRGKQNSYLALAVPLWVFRFSVNANFTPDCRNIVFYKGRKTAMVHFAFVLEYDKNRRQPMIVEPDLVELIPLDRIQVVKNGAIMPDYLDLGFPEFKRTP
jgi:hypothetical protein